MTKDLTQGNPPKVILSFALPMILGNLFQQLYNLVDSAIVGKFVGKNALAAVGSSFAVMVLITSVLIGLCMGAAVTFSQFFGGKKYRELKQAANLSFLFIGGLSLLLTVCSLLCSNQIIVFMNIPDDVSPEMQIYLNTIFIGIFFTFLYNWSANLLRSVGNSKIPLYCLITASLMNVGLDFLFVIPFKMGVFGTALATVIAQLFSALLCFFYCLKKLDLPEKLLRFHSSDWNWSIFKRTFSYSLLTSVQQSIMNFGILLVQGLVNSFGVSAMAAFAAVTKIDSFAYMPVQDFGNAFSTYIAQNHGAGQKRRIHQGIGYAVIMILIFCILISTLVILFSESLMLLFVHAEETEVIRLGQEYLNIVALFYSLIGFLFLFYGIYRGLGNVKMSIILTVISLGLRVLLAYRMASPFGLHGIWWSIPIGWLIADLTGAVFYLLKEQKR